jgi:hypothetical protein
MAGRVLVRVARRPDCGVVLRRVPHTITAPRRGAEQVQGSENPVAEQLCSYEEERCDLLSSRVVDHADLQPATL